MSLSINPIAVDDIVNAIEAAADLVVTGTSAGVADGTTVTLVLAGQIYTGTVNLDAWSVTVPALAVDALADGAYEVQASVAVPAPVAIPNAAFEIGDVPNVEAPGNFSVGSFEGWQVEQFGGLIQPVDDDLGGFIDNPSGGKFAYLNSGASMISTFTLDAVAGATYTLTFDVGARTDVGDAQGTVIVRAGTTVLGTYNFDAHAGLVEAHNFTTGAVAAADAGQPIQLVFSNPSIAFSHFLLDNVSLTASATAAEREIEIDTEGPQVVSIALSDSALAIGDSATVTVTFSEAVPGLTLAGISAPNGVLSDLATADGGVTWTATYVPDLGVESATNVITVSNPTDGVGNVGTGGSSANYVVDTIAPIFISPAGASVSENAIGTAYDADADADTGVTYSLAGADSALFAIDAAGLLTFTAAPDFEDPDDADANNAYQVTIVATDAAGNATPLPVTITITDVPDGTLAIDPIASDDIVNAAEAAVDLVVTGTAAGLADGTIVTLTLDGQNYTGTVSEGAWAVNVPAAAVGALADGDYTASASATDATSVAVINADFEIGDVPNPEAPGPYSVGSFEGWTVVGFGGLIEPVDDGAGGFVDNPTGSQFGYINSGATLTSTFALAATAGATYTLSFDAGARSDLGDTDASVVVMAGATVIGSHTFTALSGTVGPLSLTTAAVAEADAGLPITIVFTNSSIGLRQLLLDNVSMAAQVEAADQRDFSVDTDGPDVVSITLSDSVLKSGDTAILTIVLSEAIPDLQIGDISAPSGSLANLQTTDGGITWTATFTPTAGTEDATNAVSVQPTATDAAGNAATGPSSANYVVDTLAPVFTSGAAASVAENTTAVVYDANADADTGVVYTLDGADAARFSINAAGHVSFNSPPNFEAPADAGQNNVYNVSVVATDAAGNATAHAVAITVTDVNAAPVLQAIGPVSYAENGSAVVLTAVANDDGENAPIVYSLAGEDAGLFSINSQTGAVSFAAPPDFENPADADQDNVYEIEVIASDGALQDSDDVSITVTDTNDNDVSIPIDTDSAPDAVTENTVVGTAVGIVASAFDADSTSNTVTYALTQNPGGLFAIDSISGAVTTAAAIDFETAGSSVDIEVTATSADGSTAAQSFSIDIGDVGPTLRPATTFTVAENTTSVGNVAGTGGDAPVTYAIAAGLDGARFTVSAAGALSFIAAPNFEAPTDTGADNGYSVDVVADDGTSTVVRRYTVNVTNSAEAQTGGPGDDTYYVNLPGDTIIEQPNGGTDTVIASSDYVLPAEVEKLQLAAGAGDIDGTGNALANTITGNEGANALVGGDQNDTMSGGLGADTIGGDAGSDTILGDGGQMPTENAAAITRLYLATLGRAPDEAGLADWTAQLDAGTPLETIAGSFVNSPEFTQLYGTLDNPAFVTQLYANVLHRAPDAGGLANWVGLLDGGASRASVVIGFSESAEFVATSDPELHAGQIYRLYGATLDREPDAAGFLGWVDALDGGAGLGDVADGFLASAEFQLTYGGAVDNEAFVTLLYDNVLDRAPDAPGLAHWVGLLNGGMTREDVVLSFSESEEYRNSSETAFLAFMGTVQLDRNDEIEGGAGNDIMSGGRGADILVFAAGEGGTDHVYALEAWDKVRLEGFGYADASAALSHVAQVGSDAVFTDQGQTIIFHDVKLADLQASNWLVI